MNPYALLAGAALWAVSLGGASWWFYGAGIDSEKARQADIKAVRDETREIAQQGAAAAIGQLEIKHVTIRQQLETQIREKPVYRDCQHDAAVLRSINEAITGSADPAGGSQLPAAGGPQ